MQGAREESAETKMESLRLVCEREVASGLQCVDSFTASFCQSVDSIKSRIDESRQHQAKLGKMKTSLREAEDEFVKVLAVKTRKEAKQMAIRDSLSATRSKVEELKRTLEAQRARRDEYAAIMSNQYLEDKENHGSEHLGEIQEAISWYNKVLGFHVEGGRGVKFTFNNINMSNPNEEYTFTVHYKNDKYALLACDPHLNDTKELIHELNRTNGLFKFVRTMREKFREISLYGFLAQSPSRHQESAMISMTAPDLSVSTERSESSVKENEKPNEVRKQSKKVNIGKGVKQAILSPESVRRSPRFSKGRGRKLE